MKYLKIAEELARLNHKGPQFEELYQKYRGSNSVIISVRMALSQLNLLKQFHRELIDDATDHLEY